MKYVQQNKQLNNSKVNGFARILEHKCEDKFVVARPSATSLELVFNRQYQLDKLRSHNFQRYFDMKQS